jgi:hypothetical protein
VEWIDVALAGWSCETTYTTGPLHQGVTLEGTISALVFTNQQPLAHTIYKPTATGTYYLQTNNHWHILSTNHNQGESSTDKEHIHSH